MRKLKILNGFAGVGGNAKLWDNCEVTAIEENEDVAFEYSRLHKDHKVIIGCAHEYLLKNYFEYDFVWLSPPCYRNSKMVKFTRHNIVEYPDLRLYQYKIFLDNFFKGKYCIENVIPYYEPLIPPTAKIDRHYYWANFKIGNFSAPKFAGNYLKATKSELEKYYGLKVSKNIYFEGSHDPAKVLKNCVHPETGLYILNCARNIITKSNTRQLSILDHEKL